ncbi:isochorismatase family cysteine hydrolase [Stenotrophomonas sp.]|uniref:cysteine hydrolase family protein n=1 Tax=Stenotrophomonas sp. TaxID=69392 RepID=UPI0019A6177B|nr:isochorismatase family cysteine hydrolase [Stenotrophomonas sp.]MBD3825586.1 cysteine hydrolase [Stenotrophomonas sp.]
MKKRTPALLIVDMFTRFDFPNAKGLEPAAVRAASQIARLSQYFRARSLPVIYANDNFADWQMDFRDLVRVCAATEGAASTITEKLRPHTGDYFILKPKHSAFLATPLAILLAKLGTNELVVCGMTTESCIAATCFDSNAREYDTVVIRETVASMGLRKETALRLLQDSKAARILTLRSYLSR